MVHVAEQLGLTDLICWRALFCSRSQLKVVGFWPLGKWAGVTQPNEQYVASKNAKEYSNYRTIALISHASKVMLKILQARLQQYVNRELPDV